jgi:hypothetical protein
MYHEVSDFITFDRDLCLELSDLVINISFNYETIREHEQEGIAIYTVDTLNNRNKASYLEDELGEAHRYGQYIYIDIDINDEHDENVNEFYFIPELSFSNKEKGQSIKEWLGDPIDWKQFLRGQLTLDCST